jgi:hypothetical protein
MNFVGILCLIFRRAEKRGKIEANRRSREIQENNPERQQIIKQNVSYFDQ